MFSVMKFGGGILKDRQAFEKVALVIASRRNRRNVVVVSAVNGVTDKLISVLDLALTQGFPKKEFNELIETHFSVFRGTTFEKILANKLNLLFNEMKSILNGVSSLGECTPKTYARLVCFGEKLSTTILYYFVEEQGTESTLMLSEEAGIFANNSFENSTCDIAKTTVQLSKTLTGSNCFILPGFYGVDEKMAPHLFGRGGSDYSAGCIAACVNADVLEIWKDVPGFMTADPKTIEKAKVIDTVSFAEARELGYFGSKIIHPRTFECLKGRKTIVRIMNVNQPENAGTKMLEKKDQTNTPQSISEKKDVTILSVTGGGMAESAGVVGTIFNKLKEEQVPVDLISTGVSEVTFSVSRKHAKKARIALEKTRLEDKSIFDEITEQENLCHLALVGENCVNSENLSRATKCLMDAKINPVALSCPQSRISISIIVKTLESEAALNALHREFFE